MSYINQQNFSLFRASFFFLTLVQIVFSLGDYRYEACKPRSCGNNLTNLISYPFWIHEEYCGYPEFKVTCKQGEPIINALGIDYIIKDINYTEQSFRVQNSVVLEKQSCPIPLKNYTFDKSSPFQFGPNVYNLSFFYNCTKQFGIENLSWYSVNCDTSSEHYSLAFFNVVPGNPTIVQKGVELCKSWVLAPVGVYKDNPSTSGNKNYTVLMEEGFMLKYNLVKKRCTECKASHGVCGFENEELKCFCFDQPYNKTCNDTQSITVPPPPKRNIERKVKIGIGAGIGGCVLTGLVVLLIVYCRRRRKRYLDKSSGLISSRNVSPDFSMMPDQEKGFLAPIFSYKELEEATNNFDDAKELGDGGFGTVYHGELKDGRVVAVKRLYENNGKRVEQFMNEVQILSRLRHKNLVILYGCTSRHSRELLLVYEFVPNGTVADHLHGERAGSGLVPWPVRMNIAIETADALKYLHVSEIIHRDVKTNNILLDENFHVKVADFGLSRLFPTDVTHVSTAPQGTPGYVDPEYYQCYQLTSKSDVYSFGVVLVELISSKPAVDISRHRHEINLSNLAINKIHNHALHELIDPSLGFETDSSVKKMITLVAELAFRCLQQDSDMRPSMTEVLEVLKEIENEGSKKAKGVEIDIAADDIGLLKNNISPFSPDSVTQRWDSDITPNTSS